MTPFGLTLYFSDYSFYLDSFLLMISSGLKDLIPSLLEKFYLQLELSSELQNCQFNISICMLNIHLKLNIFKVEL